MKASKKAPRKPQRESPTLCRPSCRPKCCKPSHTRHLILAWINLVWCHKSFHHHQSLKKSTKKASKRISNIVQAIVHAKLANAVCCTCCKPSHTSHMILSWISLVTCHSSIFYHQSLKMGTKKASKRISNIVQAIVQAKVAKCCMLQAMPSKPHDLGMNKSCNMPLQLLPPSKPQKEHQESFKENLHHCACPCAGQSCEMLHVASQGTLSTWS